MPDLSRRAALDRCADVRDIRAAARKRVPRMVFDFVDGGADGEQSMARARDALSEVELHPRALEDVGDVDLSVQVLGRTSALPFFFAPTGATRLMHQAGETAVARTAGSFGIPYALSTLGTTSVENLARDAPSTRLWFQLYLMTDRALSRDMIDRAWASGFDTLLLTIDTPVPGRRNRDVRNGLIVPPRLSWGSMWDMSRRPSWAFDKLTTDPVDFAMVAAVPELPASRLAKLFDPRMSLSDLEWVRDVWQGKLVVKGVQSVEDAERLSKTGVDAVYVSNHGGRQLDRSPVPFELLPRVRDAVDPALDVLVDGGVLSGSDVVACLARGATAVGVGRAYLYGLMAGGALGVSRVGQILRDETRATLGLLGCRSAREATSIKVTRRGA
jgi:L-lactate dehydrogenase (cytochrome)